MVRCQLTGTLVVTIIPGLTLDIIRNTPNVRPRLDFVYVFYLYYNNARSQTSSITPKMYTLPPLPYAYDVSLMQNTLHATSFS